MKHLIIMLCLITGMLYGCNNSNKRGSKAFGKKGKKAPYYATNKNKNSNAASVSGGNSTSNKLPQAKVDTMLVPERTTYSRPGANYGSVSGPGSGGSYASSAYRHDEMNKKKYEKKALVTMKERQQINQELEKIRAMDSVSVKADSTKNSW